MHRGEHLRCGLKIDLRHAPAGATGDEVEVRPAEFVLRRADQVERVADFLHVHRDALPLVGHAAERGDE